MRLLFARQLKGVPKDMQDVMLGAIEKNPEFFKKINKEIETKVKAGQDKMFATQAVVMEHRGELAKLIQNQK